jgi:hypothetical protein
MMASTVYGCSTMFTFLGAGASLPIVALVLTFGGGLERLTDRLRERRQNPAVQRIVCYRWMAAQEGIGSAPP